jgi:hypothetical protein
MPLFEFFCNCCARSAEVLKLDPMEPHFCEGCGTQTEMVWSVPARLTPGAGGKAGGYGEAYKLSRSAEPK